MLQLGRRTTRAIRDGVSRRLRFSEAPRPRDAAAVARRSARRSVRPAVRVSDDRASEGEQSRVHGHDSQDLAGRIAGPRRRGPRTRDRSGGLSRAGRAGASWAVSARSPMTAGEYRFTRVPDGPFELALDKDKLPAAYALDEKPRPLTVTRDSRERIDLQVIPLNAIVDASTWTGTTTDSGTMAKASRTPSWGSTDRSPPPPRRALTRSTTSRRDNTRFDST